MNKPKVDFDQYTQNYNELLREGTKFFSKNEAYFAEYKVKIARREFSSEPKHVLEYGCGIGRNIPYLRAAFPGATISGSDISAASLEIARQENPGIDFFMENPDVVGSTLYDLIFVAGVFHHIPVEQRLQAMASLHKRLAPGGAVIVFEHNPFNPVTRRIVNDCPFDLDAVLLRPAELKKLYAAAGLHVEGHAYCLFVPPSLSFLLPLEEKLAKLPLGGQYWVKAVRAL